MWKRVSRSKAFKLLSSVKLAVPLLLTLAVVIGYGTILEARYSADYARLVVYDSSWFGFLLALLFLNILFAALSRIPWSWRHLGFLITHLGLLTLLMGGFITKRWGIDGQLRVVEGEENANVILPQLVLEVQRSGASRPVTITIPQGPSRREEAYFSDVNSQIGHLLRLKHFLPFVEKETGFSQGNPENGIGIELQLKNAFVDVKEWLHSSEKPEVQMGPATLRFVENFKTITTKKQIVGSKKSGLQILSAASGEVLASLNEAKVGQVVTVAGVEITVGTKFERATVVGNRLQEGGEKPNPALELNLKKSGEVLREVAFANFENFSINKTPPFGLRFSYKASASPIEHNHASEMPSNLIEFAYRSPFLVSVRLSKNGAKVLEQDLKEGETLQTPWMGLSIGLNKIVQGATQSSNVREISPPERSELPPSAVLVSTESGDFWLTEGEARQFGKGHQVYFGRRSLELPFGIQLEKFSKIDYPGTEMAMSFESLVKVSGSGEPIKISMNEPLKHDGFTLYQASYEVIPNHAPASIFSVNRDPGRAIKYLGAFILAVGIIIFTLTRSDWYKKKYGVLK